MTASTTVDLPTTGRYVVDPARSSVAFSGRHLFGLAGVKAAFRVGSGEVDITDPVLGSTVRLSVDASSFTSDKQRRDEHVRSAAMLDVEQHPAITFASSGVREQAGGWVLAGAVTALGTSVPVDVEVDSMTREGTGLRVHATARHLDRYAFGVTKVKGMAGRYLDLEFDIVADPA